MAPPRKHDSDLILDATRGLVLGHGPRAASVAAIARASGAPAGTLYHRFGSRDGVLVAVWLRALERFQATLLAAVEAYADPTERGVAMARASVEFAEHHRDDARLLIVVRRDDLLDAAPDDGLRRRIDAMNRPFEAELRSIARALYGTTEARAVAAVTRAVVLLPYGVTRLYAGASRPPAWLADDVAADTRRLLGASKPDSVARTETPTCP